MRSKVLRSNKQTKTQKQKSVLVVNINQKQKEIEKSFDDKNVVSIITHANYHGIRIPVSIINVLNLKKNQMIYWKVDIDCGMIYIYFNVCKEKLLATRLMSEKTWVYAMLPSNIFDMLNIRNGDLFKWHVNLDERRVELKRIALYSPYVVSTENTTHAYRGSPPRESVIEVTHTRKK